MSTIVIRKKSLKLIGLIFLALFLLYLGYQKLNFTLPTWKSVKEPNMQAVMSSLVPPEQMDQAAQNNNDIPLAAVSVHAKNNGEEFFAEYRLERDRVRSQQVEILREIINNPQSPPENRYEAQQKMINLTNSLQREMELENLLVAKGFRQGVAVLQADAVTVVINSPSLAPNEVSKISDLVCRTTKCKPEDVVIIPKS